MKFNVALRPHRLYGLNRTERPGRPPRLSHSSHNTKDLSYLPYDQNVVKILSSAFSSQAANKAKMAKPRTELTVKTKENIISLILSIDGGWSVKITSAESIYRWWREQTYRKIGPVENSTDIIGKLGLLKIDLDVDGPDVNGSEFLQDGSFTIF